MSKFFYKKNKKYSTGGKVKYDNGGNVTGPDTPFKIDPKAIDLAKNNPFAYTPGTRSFKNYQSYLDQPIATRNISADKFNPNIEASFTQGQGPRMSFNYNPSFLRTGPDTNYSLSEGSRGTLSIGPSLSGSLSARSGNRKYNIGESVKSRNYQSTITGEGMEQDRINLGVNYAYQHPLNKSGSLVGGVEGEIGSLLRGSNTIYGTSEGDITTKLPTGFQGGYGQISGGLGYFPKNKQYGVSANVGFGSEFSPNAGFTYGAKYHYGPGTFNIDKTRSGVGVGFGVNIPLGKRTTKNVNSPFRLDNGGKTKTTEEIPFSHEYLQKFPVLPSERYRKLHEEAIYSSDLNPYTGLRKDHPLSIKQAKMEKDAGYKSYQKQILDHRKKSLTVPKTFDNGGIMGQDYSFIPGQTTAADVYGEVPLVQMADESLNSPADDVDVLTRRQLFDKTKLGQYLGKFEKGSELASEVTSGIGAVRSGGELVGQMFDPPDPEGQKNPLISAGKGVLSGAQAGANIGKFLGPKGVAVGTVVGAGLGAITGSVDAIQNRIAANKAEREENITENQNAVRSTNMALLNYLKKENKPVIQEPESDPELLTQNKLTGSENIMQGAFGLKVQPTDDVKGKLLSSEAWTNMVKSKAGNVEGNVEGTIDDVGSKFLGDINPHVSDESYNKYYTQLQRSENSKNKGYDKDKDLWFPFSVGIGDEQNIGWGINMSTFSPQEQERISKGITTQELEKMFSNRIASHLDKSRDYVNTWQGGWERDDKSGNTGYRGKEGNWDALPDNVKLALTDFSYNLGGLEKFPLFVTAIMNNDLATAKKEYKRYYTQGDEKRELFERNKEIYNMLFKNPKSKTQIYNVGGITKGNYDHKTNPLTVVDKNGNNTGMELTGGEGVYDAEAQNEIEKALKKKNYKRVGKIIEYEINDWKKRGMYS